MVVIISTSGALRIGSPGDFCPTVKPSTYPLEHLSLYIQKHLGKGAQKKPEKVWSFAKQKGLKRAKKHIEILYFS